MWFTSIHDEMKSKYLWVSNLPPVNKCCDRKQERGTSKFVFRHRHPCHVPIYHWKVEFLQLGLFLIDIYLCCCFLVQTYISYINVIKFKKDCKYISTNINLFPTLRVNTKKFPQENSIKTALKKKILHSKSNWIDGFF